MLARHPDRPIRVPMTQPPPAYTEDRLLERHAQVAGVLSLSGLTPEGGTGCGLISRCGTRLHAAATGLAPSELQPAPSTLDNTVQNAHGHHT